MPRPRTLRLHTESRLVDHREHFFRLRLGGGEKGAADPAAGRTALRTLCRRLAERWLGAVVLPEGSLVRLIFLAALQRNGTIVDADGETVKGICVLLVAWLSGAYEILREERRIGLVLA